MGKIKKKRQIPLSYSFNFNCQKGKKHKKIDNIYCKRRYGKKDCALLVGV